MINSTCGYQNITGKPRILNVKGSCGADVGWMIKDHPWGYPMIPMQPHFHNGVAWCGVCAKDFSTRHVGQGVFVRPKE